MKQTVTKETKNLPDGNNLAEVHDHVVHLGNEEGRHRLVQGGSVHVYGGAHWYNETANPGVNVVVVFQAMQGDRHRRRTIGTNVLLFRRLFHLRCDCFVFILFFLLLLLLVVWNLWFRSRECCLKFFVNILS